MPAFPAFLTRGTAVTVTAVDRYGLGGRDEFAPGYAPPVDLTGPATVTAYAGWDGACASGQSVYGEPLGAFNGAPYYGPEAHAAAAPYYVTEDGPAGGAPTQDGDEPQQFYYVTAADGRTYLLSDSEFELTAPAGPAKGDRVHVPAAPEGYGAGEPSAAVTATVTHTFTVDGERWVGVEVDARYGGGGAADYPAAYVTELPAAPAPAPRTPAGDPLFGDEVQAFVEGASGAGGRVGSAAYGRVVAAFAARYGVDPADAAAAVDFSGLWSL